MRKLKKLAPSSSLRLLSFRGTLQRLSVALITLVMTLTAQTAWAWSGSGTSADPYLITSTSDLATLRDNVNSGTSYSGVYFKQTAPITLTSAWTPIGTNTHPFKGHYDGGGNAISGLTVSGNYQYAGLFGYISSDRVNGSYVSNELKNINIVDCNINVGSITNSEAGAIAGYAVQVKMSSCRVSGSITGYRNACGLIGNIETNASFTDCFVDVSVSGTGKQYNQNITPSVFLMSYVGYSASASGNYYHDRVGNVAVGSKESINNSATQLYTISAPSGLTMATTNATLAHGDTHYYATETAITLTVADKLIKTFSATGAASSSVAADKKSATVTIGSSDVTVSATLMALTGTSNGVTWSMSDTDSNGTYDRLTLSGSGTLSTSPWDAELAASITRVDISSTSINISGNPFSTLGSSAIIVVPSPAYGGSYTNAGFADKLRAQFGSYLFGVTTEGSTAAYKIATEDDLRNLAAVINANKDASTAISGSGKTFRQTADITLSQPFTPIGAQGTYGKWFKGTYDGGDKTISGLTVNTDKQYAGLFGKVMGATIKNVRLIIPYVNTSFNVSGYACAGALVGYAMESSKVENCFVFSPNVSATNNQRYVGAIVGSIYSSSDKLTNSLFYSDANYGFAGNYANGNITNSGRARIVTLGSGIASVSPDASDMANGIVYQNKTYYREGVTLALPNNAPEGYSPIYSANGTAINGNTYTVNGTDGNVTLTVADGTAPISYTITYHAGNGATFSTDKNSYTIESGDITLDTPTREHYTFLGWYTNEGLTGSAVTSVGHGSTGSVELWAKWGLPYIDTDGHTQYCTSATVLTSGTNIVNLSAGWYVVTENVSYSSRFHFGSGNSHLILCDGAKMTVDNSSGDADAIAVDGSLTIYAQSAGSSMGQLEAKARSNIYCGIFAVNNLTICGGQITATGRTGISAFQNLTIYGGQITATCQFIGIYASSNITLGWSNASDYIHASSYGADGTLKIADGQTFWNGSYVLSGTISDMIALNGKTLTPISGVAITTESFGRSATFSGTSTEPVVIPAAIEVKAVSLQRSFANGKYATLMLPFSLGAGQMLTGAEIYQFVGVEQENGQWIATMQTPTSPLQANTPYLVKPLTGNLTNDGYLTFGLDGRKVTLQTAASANGSTNSDWQFKGTYSRLEYKSDGSKDLDGWVYGFASTTKDVSGEGHVEAGQFVHAKDGASVPPMRCYLTYKNGSQFAGTRGMTRGDDDDMPQTITVRFVNSRGEVTAIGTLNTQTGEITTDGWYTLNGTRLNGKPSKRGIYINNGRKIVIK